MRKPQIFSILLLVALVLPLASPLEASHSQGAEKSISVSKYYEDREGYELLSAVLENEAEAQKLRKLEIYGQTVVASVRLSICKELPEEFRPAAQDFGSKAESKLKFRREFSMGRPYRLTSSYGAADFGISAVGFDSTRTHAVVSVDRGCGINCSGGSTYLFRKTESGWQKVGQICQVMS